MELETQFDSDGRLGTELCLDVGRTLRLQRRLLDADRRVTASMRVCGRGSRHGNAEAERRMCRQSEDEGKWPADFLILSVT